MSSVDYTPEDLRVTNLTLGCLCPTSVGTAAPTSQQLYWREFPSGDDVTFPPGTSQAFGHAADKSRLVVELRRESFWVEWPWVCVCETVSNYLILCFAFIIDYFVSIYSAYSFFFLGSSWHTFDSLPEKLAVMICAKVLFGAFALFQITLRTPASSRNNIHNSCVFELVKNCFLLRKEMRLASCWRTSDDGQDQTVILGSAGQSLKWKCSCCLGELRYCF